MKKKHYFIILIVLFYFACDAAEELFKPVKPPEVEAIQSDKGFYVNVGDTVAFSVTATNPEEGELTYEWKASGGTIVGSNKQSNMLWKATGGGDFQISVDVSNNEKTTSKSADITVASFDIPFVKIINPSNGDYLVEGTMVEIEFEAIHDNGISQVYVEVNDSTLQGSFTHNQNIYSLNWKVFGPAGLADIKVLAQATTGAIGSQSIRVTIEGILPGKAGE